VQTRRLQESFEGSYRSLAYSSGELSRVIASYCSRQWETHAFSDFGGKMGFLGHNFGSRHTRRSNKSSIDAGDHLVSKKVSAKILAHWIGVQGPSKLVKKQKTPPFARPSQAKPSPKSKNLFFNRTKKTCCIRRGFEQFSSYSGWRVITNIARANLLALAVVEGFIENGSGKTNRKYVKAKLD